MEDLILLNNFLGAFGNVKRGISPFQFVTEVSGRVSAVGFVVATPADCSVFNEPHGEAYLLLDQYPVFGESQNRLFAKFGQSFYLNVCWADNGAELCASVVSDTDLRNEIEAGS
jgi:hypothetical protein